MTVGDRFEGYPETDFLPEGAGIDHVFTGGGPFGVDGAETVRGGPIVLFIVYCDWEWDETGGDGDREEVGESEIWVEFGEVLGEALGVRSGDGITGWYVPGCSIKVYLRAPALGLNGAICAGAAECDGTGDTCGDTWL